MWTAQWVPAEPKDTAMYSAHTPLAAVTTFVPVLCGQVAPVVVALGKGYTSTPMPDVGAARWLLDAAWDAPTFRISAYQLRARAQAWVDAGGTPVTWLRAMAIGATWRPAEVCTVIAAIAKEM